MASIGQYLRNLGRTFLRNILDAIRADAKKHRHVLSNGNIITRHGRVIVPLKITSPNKRSICSNFGERVGQPRFRELFKLMTEANGSLYLHRETGKIFLASDFAQNGQQAKPLDVIDMQVEHGLYKLAGQLHRAALDAAPRQRRGL